MADPNMEQAARASEEYSKYRGNRNGMPSRAKDTDSEDNFKAQEESIRNADALYRDRQAIMREINDLLKERERAMADIPKYEARADAAKERLERKWVSVDGREFSMTYDEYLDQIEGSLGNDNDKEYIRQVRTMLNQHPGAISAAQRAGFSFVSETEFDPKNPVGSKESMEMKVKQFAFLQDRINEYNKRNYTPYYDRKSAYDFIDQNPDAKNAPFGLLKKSKDFPYDRKDFEREAEKYGVDARTIEKWYKQSDKVILSFERDAILDGHGWHGVRNFAGYKIDVDYTTLNAFSAGCAKIQAETNRDGVHVENLFDAITDSADAHHDLNENINGVKRTALEIDDIEANIRKKRDSMDIARVKIDEEYENRATTGSGLRAMYDAEMGRYRNGFTQQPPLMWDMANRWAKGKTRFLDGRRQMKEQMRDQKFTAKTGIAERGIKTGGTFGEWFKSVLNEIRRGVYNSGAADISLFGDTDRLILALGMDAAQNTLDNARMRIMKGQDKLMDRRLRKYQMAEKVGDFGSEPDMDAANYTNAIQIASEASTNKAFNGDEKAAADYDGRDNNPADVMAGWDNANEHHKDPKQLETDLQNLLDDKGYNTDNDGPDIDGPEA